MFDSTFLQALQTLAIAAPESVLRELVEFLPSTLNNPSARWHYQLLQVVPSVALRSQIIQLIELWQKDYPSLPPEAIVLALMTTTETAQQYRTETAITPVWTVPRRSGDWLRQTEPTILELIAEAQQELLIISFAVYNVPQIVEALLAALQRNVKIQLVVEIPEAADKIPFGILQAFPTHLLEQLEIYYWPKSKRPTDHHGKYGSLHIKAIVSDQSNVFIGSANLTQYAFAFNMELGIILQDKKSAEQIITTIESLIKTKILLPLPSSI